MESNLTNQATNPSNEADLICEAILREMARGGRWKAIVDAWQALLTVRRMGDAMQAERVHLSGAANSSGSINRAHST